MKKLVKLFLFFGLFIAVAGCKNLTDGSAELEKIEITTLPTKLEYYENDSLDLEGLVVTAVYSNGTTVDVTKNIKTSGFDSSVATESQTITVTYKEKSATFEIKINPLLLTGIEITAEPEKKEYHLGAAALDLTGLNVIARYNNDKNSSFVYTVLIQDKKRKNFKYLAVSC